MKNKVLIEKVEEFINEMDYAVKFFESLKDTKISAIGVTMLLTALAKDFLDIAEEIAKNKNNC